VRRLLSPRLFYTRYDLLNILKPSTTPAHLPKLRPSHVRSASLTRKSVQLLQQSEHPNTLTEPLLDMMILLLHHASYPTIRKKVSQRGAPLKSYLKLTPGVTPQSDTLIPIVVSPMEGGALTPPSL